PRSRPRSTAQGHARRVAVVSYPGLRDGVEDAYAAEESGRRTVADRCDLTGLALAAEERAAEQVGLWTADRLHRAPEVGRRRLVGEVLDLAGQLAVHDQERALRGELEVVALLVDREGILAHEIEPARHARDQLRGGRPGPIWLQAHVRHPLDRH